MNLVTRPHEFDVLLATNLLGDILSDVAGAVTGGIGLAPSASIDPDRRAPGLFEPAHGSAPDIAGRDLANPVGAIRAAAMLLDWLCEHPAAARIERAADRITEYSATLRPVPATSEGRRVSEH